ncbi:DUF2079 domain-containing protein [Streptomyces sp. NPDC004788]
MTTRAGAVQDQVVVVPRQRRRSGWAGAARGRGLASAVLCFVVCCGLGLQSWAALRVTGFDLGIFDQAVRAYAQFAPPRSAIKSVHHEFPPDFTLLGDHFTPLLALLAPLYWLWDDPRTLILAQAALFAAGVPVMRRIARHCFPDRAVVADVAGLVYAIGWPLLDSAYTGFHEVAFAVPLTLLMLERGMARRYGTAALWAALLCLVKEDMGLVAGAFGLLLLVRARREPSARDRRAGRVAGLGLLLGGPLVVALVVGWFLPAMGSPPGYYWSYGRIGADGGAALARVLTEPWVVPWVAVTPPVKLVLLLWVLGTLAFLPLGSATTLLALPLLAERLLSDNGNHWTVVNHYDAFLWPILLTAALETLARLRGPYRKRLGVAALALSTGAAVFLGLGLLVNPGSWQPRPDKRALAHAAELIPDGATVEADNAVAPRLTRRTSVVLADGTPRGADWVLLGVHGRTFPFHSVEEQQARVRMLLDHGYVEVWHRDGAVLLRRAETRPIPGMRVPGPDSTPVRERVPADVGHNPFGR